MPDIWSRQVPVSRGGAPIECLGDNSHRYCAVAMELVSIATISGFRGTLPLHNISISGLQVRASGVRRLRRRDVNCEKCVPAIFVKMEYNFRYGQFFM